MTLGIYFIVLVGVVVLPLVLGGLAELYFIKKGDRYGERGLVFVIVTMLSALIAIPIVSLIVASVYG